VALWLDNMYDDEVNEQLLDELDTIPSFKFVPLVPQLAAHINNDIRQQYGFSARIFRILERCSLEHPYHTLPVVLALKNLHSDDEYESDSTGAKKEERRVLGAKKLLSRLIDSSVRTIIHEMENLSRALLSLAYWQPKGKCYSNKRYAIPREQPISKVLFKLIRHLSNILIDEHTVRSYPFKLFILLSESSINNLGSEELKRMLNQKNIKKFFGKNNNYRLQNPMIPYLINRFCRSRTWTMFSYQL